MPDAKPAVCPPSPTLSAGGWLVGLATGAAAAYLLFKPMPAPVVVPPAGQVDVSQLIGGQATLDRLAQQFGAQLGPMLIADVGLQRNIGTAIGQELGHQFRIPAIMVAGAFVVGAGALVVMAAK